MANEVLSAVLTGEDSGLSKAINDIKDSVEELNDNLFKEDYLKPKLKEKINKRSIIKKIFNLLCPAFIPYFFNQCFYKVIIIIFVFSKSE